MREFVQAHDANKMSAPLNTEFLLREEELKTAKEKLALSDVLVLTGPAGIGKTRLALQLCSEVAEEYGYEVICVKSNGLELYDDLITSIECGKDYLVLIDDANELTGLHLVLDYLPKAAIGQKHIKKIVVTVRDYARQKVVQEILEVEQPEILRVGLLKDEEIKKLIEAVFGIKNYIYLDRIVAIAEGNARLAILAGKIASETEKINSIRDATDLYAHYYGKQINHIAGNATEIASAGILAFFQTLRLDGLDRLQPIFSAVNLDESQFISDLKHLHDLELVDLCHDKAAKISDQSFSNYLIKYVFVDKEIIFLSQMVENCFFINSERTVSACNILLHVFGSESVQEYVEQQINIVWDNLRSDEGKFPAFFKAFHMIRPTDTLVLLKGKIDRELPQVFDVQSIIFKKTDSEKGISDDVISTLCSFSNHEQVSEAIELLLLYYRKRPDLFEQVYSAFVSSFGVDTDSWRMNYFTQATAVKQLCDAIESDPSDNLLLLFIRVAEQFLKFRFSRTKGGRGQTFTVYTIPLTLCESVLEYRKVLLEQLYKIYNEGKAPKEMESLLADYCRGSADEVQYKIVKEELDLILPFFSLFSIDNLYHCVIAEHIRDIAIRGGYNCGDVLTPFFESRKYQIYHTLNNYRAEMLHMGFDEYDEWHRKQIQEMVFQYSIDDFRYLLRVCKECLETVDCEGRLLSCGIEYAIESFYENQELYINVVREYLLADTPYDVNIYRIMRNLFSIMCAEEVKALLDSCDFSQKNTWLWAFYATLPAEQVTSNWAEKFLLYLEDIPQHIRQTPYRPLKDIEKYECADKDIIIKASRVIVSHYEESPFIFNLYFFFMMNPQNGEANRVITKFQKDIPLLENIYLKCTSYSSHEDYDGRLLAAIIEVDPSFIKQYLDCTLKESHCIYSAQNSWVDRLDFIWKRDSYIADMDQISNYIIETKGRRYLYSDVIGHMLLHKSGKTIDTVAKRQEDWIQHTIEICYMDQERMYELFSAIDEDSAERRKHALEILLKLNEDYDMFEKLPLESSHWGGMGSMIPYMQERITYLESLLPLLTDIAFLKHRQKVEHDIKVWKDRIKREEIDELIEALG